MTIKEASTTTEFVQAGDKILKLNRGSVLNILAKSGDPTKVVVLSVMYSKDQKGRVDYLNAMETSRNSDGYFEPHTITRNSLINPNRIEHMENEVLQKLFI